MAEVQARSAGAAWPERRGAAEHHRAGGWHPGFVSWVESTWKVSSVFAVAVGAIVLAGWVLGFERVTTVFPNTVSMKANTAFSLILLGAGLWLLAPPAPGKRRRTAGLALAVGAAAIGLATLTEYTIHRDLGIDQLLVNDRPGARGTSSPGRMASATAFSFVMLGGALILLRMRDGRFAQLPALAAALTGTLALASYVYEAHDVLGFGRHTQIAVHTSVAIVVLGLGVLSARPAGLMGTVVSRGPGGAAARQLLPAALVVPLFLGWLRLLGERQDLYGTELGLAIFATSNVVVFVALIWVTARSLNATDSLRVVAEQEARELNEELEARVVERTAELQAANEELEAFSYSISHDLRAPLRAIDGFSRILEEEHEGELDPEARRFLGIIRGNVRQMGDLVDDLLAFSRLSRQPVNRRPVNPATIVEDAIASLAVPPERRAQISIGPLPVCSADPALLKQVYVNLISNALKFSASQPEPRIEIGATSRDGSPVFFVRDNGVGFDMRYAGKLFGVFQRLHPADEYEGTGVGLAIVQRIVYRHGGSVWAEAEVGRGATFYFTMGKGDGRADGD